MAIGIIKIIDAKYAKLVGDECLDIIQIKNICNLYKLKTNESTSISLHDINITSPEFKKVKMKKTDKRQQPNMNILKSVEFQKKYRYFIKIIYVCLKMNVTLFDITNNITTLKNNYQLIRALELTKKNFVTEHINVLKNQQKRTTVKVDPDYENYIQDYIVKMKITDRIITSINKLLTTEIIDKTDNLLSLILPYFYTYVEYIEEYN